MAKGSADWPPSPDPRPKSYLVTKTGYRGEIGPNTKNPAGGADGVGLAASGGSPPNCHDRDSGDRGGAVQLAITISRGRPGKVQARSASRCTLGDVPEPSFSRPSAGLIAG
jgi:hypothetical protein